RGNCPILCDPIWIPDTAPGAPGARLLAFAALELRAALAAGLLDDELDAPVLAPAGFVVLAADRLRLAVAVAAQLARQHVALFEGPPHGRGAPLGQIQVVGVVAALVGVALDLDLFDPGVAVDRRRDGVDDREGLGLDDVLVGLEVDR